MDLSRIRSHMTIYTHTANANYLLQEVEKLAGTNGLQWITIRTSEFIDKERHSGKYIMPDGSIVEAQGVRIHTRFIDYGPEDIEHLLFMGVLQEHMEAYFYIVDPMWSLHSYLMPVIRTPSVVLCGGY